MHKKLLGWTFAQCSTAYQQIAYLHHKKLFSIIVKLHYHVFAVVEN